jgi:membrane protease YdiL (CAAX protease family)
VLSWIRIRSGSVIAPSIVHGTINASAGLAVLYLRGGSDLTVGLTGVAGFVALAPVLVAVFCLQRKKDARADCKTMQKLV